MVFSQEGYEEFKKESRRQERKVRKESRSRYLAEGLGEFSNYNDNVRPGRYISKAKSRRTGRAITGILGAFLPPEAMVGAVSYAKRGKKPGGGRGRPKGTFKARYVPGYGTVRVPTSVYKKMLSDVKRNKRLAEAQRQARLVQLAEQKAIRQSEQQAAESIAMSQDPRFSSGDESFLEEPDMEHETRIANLRQRQVEQQMLVSQRQPSGILSRVGRGIGQIMRGGYGGIPTQPSPYLEQPTYERTIPMRRVAQVRPPRSRISIVSDKSNILTAPNIFNRPGDSRVLFR